jgi:uncharacterized protein
MIIADTGFWVALIDRNDRYHSRAVAAHENIDERFVSTHAVVTEISHLLISRVGAAAHHGFLTAMAEGAFDVRPTSGDRFNQILELCRKYDDQRMDFADASLVVLAEELGDGRILTTDADFDVYRWKSRRRFENLLR